jgi:hypothetical protein
MDFFMKNTKVKSQHQEYENVESDPEVNAYSHVLYIRLQTYKKSPYPEELQSYSQIDSTHSPLTLKKHFTGTEYLLSMSGMPFPLTSFIALK